MGFIEGVFTFIGWCLAIAAIIAMVVIGGAAIAFILGFTLLTGWIPIFMCGTDPDWNIRWSGGGFVDRWAFLATLEYLGLSLTSIYLLFTRPDPDGLPPAWKFLSMFYVSKSAKHVYAAIGEGAPSFDFKGFARDIDLNKASRREELIEQRHLKQAKEEMERETERLNLAKELDAAAVDLEVAKAEREAYEKAVAEEKRLEELLKRHGRL